MPHIPTDEQLAIINAIADAEDGTLVTVEAVAGASKTWTLVKSAIAAMTTNGLYISYNKANAVSAAEDFPKVIECSTTHSLAYQIIVKYGLDLEGNTGDRRDVDWFTYKCIKEKIDYSYKVEIIAALDEYFLSESIDHKSYFAEHYPDVDKLCNKYVEAMWNKQIPCTHNAYLKLYHILLANELIHYDPVFDLLMLDEAGDINRVTLEIFRLLPSKIKVIVGDSQQNIYSFNNTINAFEVLANQGINKRLSQSFRCSKELGEKIQMYCQAYLDPKMIFIGTDHQDKSIRTEAILSRTNGGLIGHMIDLVRMGDGFNLVRPANEIFKVCLILAGLSSTAKIYDSRYKHLIDDAKIFETSPELKRKYKMNLLSYIYFLYADLDRNLKSAITTIRTYGKKAIFDTYKIVQEYEKSGVQYDLTLTTAHSSKGLTWDSVTLANDFNLDDIIEVAREDRTNEEQEELRLYYVALTRARIELIGAKYIKDF